MNSLVSSISLTSRYKRGSFVLEAKQGKDAIPASRDALLRALKQKFSMAKRGTAG